MKMFRKWLNKSPEQIIEERKNDLKTEDPREQRRYESYLKAFVNYLREEKEYSTASCQVAWASVKSFLRSTIIRCRCVETIIQKVTV